jgi:hypothetical protein
MGIRRATARRTAAIRFRALIVRFRSMPNPNTRGTRFSGYHTCRCPGVDEALAMRGGRLDECALRIVGVRVQARVLRTALLLSELTKLGPGVAIYRANTRHYLTASDKELLGSSDRRGRRLHPPEYSVREPCLLLLPPDPACLDCPRTGLFSSPHLRKLSLATYTQPAVTVEEISLTACTHSTRFDSALRRSEIDISLHWDDEERARGHTRR